MIAVTKVIFLAAVMFSVIGGLTLLSHIYTLNIKSKTVGDGQHGTARFATKQEIARTYKRIPFCPQAWRTGKDLPAEQGIILGCEGQKDCVTALVDTDDVHTLMIGASGVGKTAYFLYPNLEYACATGMVKPTRRTNSILDDLNRLVNADSDRKTLDEAFAYAFDLAWLTGGCPKLEYEEQVWKNDLPLEEAINEYTLRISSAHELTARDKEKIKEYLENVAVDGIVHETSNTSLAAMYWHEKAFTSIAFGLCPSVYRRVRKKRG